MSEHIQAKSAEVIKVTSEKIHCDGPEFSKHPRVYLTLKGGEEGEVVCPYCSRIFRLDATVSKAK